MMVSERSRATRKKIVVCDPLVKVPLLSVEAVLIPRFVVFSPSGDNAIKDYNLQGPLVIAPEQHLHALLEAQLVLRSASLNESHGP